MTYSTRHHSDRAIEWLFAAMMVAWGFYLWLPFNTFASAQYTMLRALAPEVIWGTFSVAIGSVRMVALIINGQIRQTPVIRAGGAVLGAIWWLVLAWLFVTGNSDPPPAGVIFYPIFVGAEFYSALRCGGDAFLSGAFRRRAQSAR